MQVVRLSRVGRNKYPVYRIVAADKRRAATGKFVHVLGHYNPHTKELVIKKEQLQTAINNGAQPSNAVLKLMKKDGIKLPKWASIEARKRAPKKEADVKEEAKIAEVPAQEAEAAQTEKPAKENSATPKEAEQEAKAAEKQEEVAEVVEEITKKEADSK